ncbi:MAG: AAA family ATPase [Blastocatellia bacterium]
MPQVKALSARNIETGRNVWSLLTKDFHWSHEALSRLRVGVHSPRGSALPGEVKLQPFEVIVAAVFARLRPDYDWWVTPNLPDGGIDFIGRGVFLSSKELGIDAAITIGGQCKKHEHVNSVVSVLSGSFVNMAHTLHPTFFVAALSSSLSTKRVAEARLRLEATLQRHCHILDRGQLESLIGANLIAVEPIISKAFSQEEADYILNYFMQCSGKQPTLSMRASAPASALAGESFRVRMQISRSSIAENPFRLKWNPSAEQSPATLVAPIAADSRDGVALDFLIAASEDPFVIEQELEFLLYAVGSQPLGTVELNSTGKTAEPIVTIDLPNVDVIENLRPPFYEVPYREPLDELERGLARARAGKVSCVGIVGAGGAGKTRLCEEMCLEARRHGAHVTSARQAHSIEFPRRILANLLLALTDISLPNQPPTNRIDDILSRLEPKLADRARPAIEALCGQAGKAGSFEDDQSLLSVLAVLIAQRSRSQTVIIHLHDLHWCTLDVLETIDRLIWQLDHLKVQPTSDAPLSGLRVLFLLEGRMHEHRAESKTDWSTKIFERFIKRLDCPVAQCRAFEPYESATFAQRLFEQQHSANRMLPSALLKLQQELIATIYHVAGGNPLHMLEQVKLLQQHGILAQNPRTGFIYMVRPEFHHVPLPLSVFETIEARWRYYSLNDRKLAVLLWAAALVDDNLPPSLFEHLWSRIAPDVTQKKIESTEFLRFPQSDEEGMRVSFRHENYFQTVRRIQLPEEERRVVIEAYSEWFSKAKGLSPVLRYVQAKVELESPSPDFKHVRRILRATQDMALRRQDRSLTSRILATLLDGVTWPSHEQKPLSVKAFISACDDEVALCRNLIRSGQTDVAYDRIQYTLRVIDGYLNSHHAKATDGLDTIRQRKFTLLMLKAGILYHARQPAEALAITDDAVKALNVLIADASNREQKKWREVIMEVSHTHSVAVALAGDLERAVVEARKAADIAETLLKESSQALEVIITYTNILLCESPEESELILQRYLDFSEHHAIERETLLRLNLNLSMARIILSHREAGSIKPDGVNRLAVAHETLLNVFKQAHPLGRLSNAAAAALLIGLIHAIWNKPDEVDWFSQAVSLAVRARQLETLWRAYINLAHGLYRSGQSPHDPAAAALDIMTFSLRSYAEPDRTPRFNLLSVPMAHAVRYLILDGDAKADKALRDFPALRRMVTNVQTGQLKEDRDGRASHEWLRIGEADYVIY